MFYSKYLKDLSIRKKLLVGFLSMGVLTVLFGLYLLFTFTSLYNSFKNLAENNNTMKSFVITNGGTQGDTRYDKVASLLDIQTAIIKDEESHARSLQIAVISILIVSLFIVLGISYFLSQLLARPIRGLALVAQRIAEGDLSVRADVVNKDEIGDLAKAFNTMAEKLQELYTNMDSRIMEKTKAFSDKVDEVEKSKLAILNLLEDIENEKKKVEAVVVERTKELTSEKARLLASMNSLSLGFIIADMDNHVLLKNKAMIDLFGLDESEERSSVDHISQILEAQFDIKNRLKLCLADKNVCEIKDISSKDRFLRGIIAPVITPDDNEMIGYVFLLEDVTESRLIDRAKSEFVSLASHQLRTPLSSINWYTEMLSSGDAGDLNEEQKDYIAEVSNASKRMSDMVGMLLNVSRIELGTFIIDPVPTDICILLKDQLEQFKVLIEQTSMETDLVCDSRNITVNIDPMIMDIVIQNLISNAIKYTPEKGRLKIEVFENKSDHSVSLSVADNGYGIEESQQSKIFTKLFRADNIKTKDTEGNGLGLYMIKTMLEQAGCTISFKSKENHGTTFLVTIPKNGMRKKAGTKLLGELKS